MIVVDDFHKQYDQTLAVHDLSFRVEPGEVLGLIGPNGAGKTTTLRSLAGIVNPSRGQLSVAGHDVSREPIAAKSQLAYVPDDPPNFSDLTVGEHLAFTASVYRVDDAQRKANTLLEQFELAAKQSTPARSLSRGMRQKLAICCAYLYDPAVLLLDEPLTGLDPHGIRTLKRTIRERADNGAAAIVSSHLLAMVEDVCTHVLILDKGTKQFCGPIEDLYRHYEREQQATSLEDIFFAATT
ncbi:ABC transporter ATP-binding protein [Aeoliella sp. ICT_H6.2]|uniref:ABC transporter ATP-binding protein n=1 Tax=Aeoliella straminimaris TaxID=2954799 RepID=A0A9X2F996_9BACT|nr:ABC transporter ATP-binding protein [Aeoliella straminimaris]MCO6044670.1 ABC transporter ATP-binding protein [Aeoliella straminimaris]